MLNTIIGHDFQRSLLQRAAKEGVVSHAYLFTGPDGVGKKLVALEFAKLLNCISDERGSMTGQCECGSCRKVQRGIHPDVVLVEYEGINDIKVDQIREAVEDKLFLKPFEGAFKVVIVDESERMNRSAQNAFLKTLEEPPPNSIIILLSSRSTALLPTICSRCQIVSFSALPLDKIARILKKETKLSGPEVELISRLSEGSPGLALKFDMELIDWRRDLLCRIASLDSRSAGEIMELADIMPTESTAEDSQKLRFAIEFISLWLRDLIMIKIEADKKYLTHTDMIEVSRRAAEGLSTDDILERQANLEQAWNDIFYANANKRLSLENLFIKLAMDTGVN